MQTHQQQRHQIAQTIRNEPGFGGVEVKIGNVARQGDLMIHVTPLAEKGINSDLPDAAFSVATGAHGDHVALGRFTVTRNPERPEGCQLEQVQLKLTIGHEPVCIVHTDAPNARHKALIIPANSAVYACGLQELDLTGVVRQVKD